jgi:hypothetical protein
MTFAAPAHPLPRTAVLVAAVAATALALSACGSETSSSRAGETGKNGSGSDSDAATATAPATVGNTGTGKSRCATSELFIDFERPGAEEATGTSTDEQRTVKLLFNNRSDRTCTLEGFPGVTLKAGADTWDLVRSSATPVTVTLAPGGSAHSELTFLPYASGESTEDAGSGAEFEPTTALVTPPGDTVAAKVRWIWGGIVRQDGATRPGTYIGPVTAK